MPKHFIDGLRFADQRESISGEIPVQALQSWLISEAETAGMAEDWKTVSLTRETVTYQMTGYVDDFGKKHLKGNVNAFATIACSVCLEPMTVPIDADFDVTLIQHETEEKSLPKTSEPWVLDENGLVDIRALCVEEIHLNLPYTAEHNDFAEHNVGIPCRPITDTIISGDNQPTEIQKVIGKKKNPFDILASLKSDMSI